MNFLEGGGGLILLILGALLFAAVVLKRKASGKEIASPMVASLLVIASIFSFVLGGVMMFEAGATIGDDEPAAEGEAAAQ